MGRRRRRTGSARTSARAASRPRSRGSRRRRPTTSASSRRATAARRRAATRRSLTTGAPAVQTGAAQAVGASGATLTGTVDPNGRATSWYFEYGTSTRYGSRTTSRDAGSGADPGSVSIGVGGLDPGATYHFRLVARSSDGTAQGADASFRTSGALAATIRLAAPVVVYGRRVTLTGTVSSGASGQRVAILGQSFGDAQPSTLATVTTGAGGRWTYLAQPPIRTAYQSSWSGATSAASVVAVRPAVSLGWASGGRLSTHVSGRTSFAGRIVQLQRRSGSRWVTIARHRLNGRSSTSFRPSLPRGTSELRVAMSVNQAGAGYLAGFSRTVVHRR
jgi:hypothetical protein